MPLLESALTQSYLVKLVKEKDQKMAKKKRRKSDTFERRREGEEPKKVIQERLRIKGKMKSNGRELTMTTASNP
jgi:hypothetical protein